MRYGSIHQDGTGMNWNGDLHLPAEAEEPLKSASADGHPRAQPFPGTDNIHPWASPE
jgi:hypothetical protein